MKPILSTFVIGGLEILFLLVVALLLGGLILAAVVVSRRLNLKNAPLRAPSEPASATKAAIKECPRCHKPLAADAPGGLCPSCLAKAAVETEPAPPIGTNNVNPLAEAGTETRVPPDPAELAAQFPQLEVIELLGRGGMGMVYKARQPRLDRFVALKILPTDSMRSPSFAERFEREAKALARLNHPGIVAIYDFGQTGKYYYFIMEYVDGMNLRRLLQSHAVEPRQALELVVQICTSLQYAHDAGVVHRDIKPENILLNKKGQVKIADFGLAKLLGNAPDTALTMSQVAMGTLNYMAPEQRENAQKVDHRADIYSLGVVFYELLTGQVPMGRFVPPSKKVQVSVRLDEVVLKALEREPEQRYQKVSEVKTDIESVARTAPALTPGGAPAAPNAEFEFPPPGAGSESELKARLIRKFWLKALGFWILGWLVAAMVWVEGPSGKLSGLLTRFIPILGIYSLMWWTLMQRLSFMRQLSAEARRVFHIREEGLWRRVVLGYVLTGVTHLCMLLPLVAVFSASSAAWESFNASQVPAANKFVQQYSGKEHHFLRSLSAFTNAVPATELRSQPTYQSFSALEIKGWTGVVLALLFGFMFLQWPPLMVFGLVRARFSWAHYWRPWLAYNGTAVGSGLLVFWGLFAVSYFTYFSTDGIAQPRRQTREIRCPLDLEAASRTVGRCLIQRGYQGGVPEMFAFDTVPKGDTVARLEIVSYGKLAWRLGWKGMRRVSPLLNLKLLSSMHPTETVITLEADAGRLLSREAAAEWLAEADALVTAVTLADSSTGAGLGQDDSASKGASRETERGTTTNFVRLKVNALRGQNLIAPGLYESTTVERTNQTWGWQKTRLLILRGNIGKAWRAGVNPFDGVTVAVLKDPAGNTALQIVDDPSNAIPAGPFLYRIVQSTTDGFILDNGETLKRQP